MTSSITSSGRSKAAHTTSPLTRNLSPFQAYAVRTLTRRARFGISHALLIAELASIFREGAHE